MKEVIIPTDEEAERIQQQKFEKRIKSKKRKKLWNGLEYLGITK